MPSAEILTIGTEILLGEIVDTNASYLARQLRQIGVDVFRKVSIGDNPERIATAIKEAFNRSDIVITTGGLGPTVDDPTRSAVALAFGVELEFHPELWEQIQSRFRRYQRTPTENNKQQAYIPRGATPIENPVGTAPAFEITSTNQYLACLPGVPREMEYLMDNVVIPRLKEYFHLQGVIKTRTLHTIGAGESLIDSKIADLETLSNPTVGLAAHSGQVDIRITAKSENESLADAMIKQIEVELRSRLGNWIIGADEESIEHLALQSLQQKNWTLAVCEAGTGGLLSQRLVAVKGIFAGGHLLPEIPSEDELIKHTDALRLFHQADCGVGCSILYGKEVQSVYICVITPNGQQFHHRPYGGPSQNAPRWALHHCLDILRNQ